MNENKLVYICSPYAGDVGRNVEFAKAACWFAMEQNCTPVAVHLLYPQLLDDFDPVQRKIDIRMGLRVLESADELWICGSRISEGMRAELAAAKQLGVPVKQVSELEIQGGTLMKQYGVWAVRSAASVCGAAQSWCKHGGKPMEFDTMEQAAEYVIQLNQNLSTMNVYYYPKEMEPELAQGSGFFIQM